MNAPALPALRLVLGDEELLVSRAIAEVISAARAVDSSADIREHEAGQLSVGELAELFSPSLFGERRVVVIRQGQDARKDLTAALLTQAAAVTEPLSLVVAHAGGAKGKAFADGLKKAGAEVVAAARVTKWRDRIAFVRQEFRHLGARCPDDAAEALIAAVGNDLRELAAACAQLVADTGGKITTEVVGRYYRGRAEVSGFAVADAAIIGDVPGALEALHWAIAVGVDPVPIADAIADSVRTVARVASVGGANSRRVAEVLGLPPWKAERALRQARGWTANAIVDAMRVAADLNAAVKGGGQHRQYAIERAIMDLAEIRRGEERSAA